MISRIVQARPALAVAAALALSPAFGADNDTQVVNFEVQAINELDVAAGPISLTINTATAGSAPTAATASSSYAITTNAATDSRKITASLDSPMPTGLTLEVNVTAPSGTSTSAGTVTLSNTPVDVVTGIEGVAASGIAINYTLTAAMSAEVATGSRTVTYTIDAT